MYNVHACTCMCLVFMLCRNFELILIKFGFYGSFKLLKNWAKDPVL